MIEAHEEALRMLGIDESTDSPSDLELQKQAAEKLWSLTCPKEIALQKALRAAEEQCRREAYEAALKNLGGGHG